MPRKPRIEFEGAFYHVITRGNQRQRIFKDAVDYQKYLQLLTIYKNRYRFLLYAYVLMGNHVHLLIEAGETPLSKALQGLNQSYTMYFNKRYKTVGHLFQGRYKAILCDKDAYALALLKYIHYNPVRAKIAETPDAYPWSSHHAYPGKANPLGMVDTDQILRMFSENKGRARRHYRAFMHDEAGIKREDVYAVTDQRIQGDEQFVDRVMEKHEGEITKERRKKEYSLSQIAHAVEVLLEVAVHELRSESRVRAVANARRVLSRTAREFGYKGAEIAQYLNKDPAAVSGYWKRAREGRETAEAVIRQLQRMK